MKLQVTISLCKLLSETKEKQFMFLRQSLLAIQSYAKTEEDEKLRTLIETTVSGVNDLLHINERLAENDNNPEVKAELLIKIADSYF